MIDNKYLRDTASRQLGESIWCDKWLLMLAICAVWELISGGISALTVPKSAEEFSWLELAGTLLICLIEGPFVYGICRATVKVSRGEKASFQDCFIAFKEDFTGSLFVGFLYNLFIILWSLLLIVPGIIKSYAYSMAMYIKQDEGATGKQSIDYLKESETMMKGYKWQLFCLDFSFIGWYFLGALCLGIGVLFVVPYHQVARANFYKELKKERMENFLTND